MEVSQELIRAQEVLNQERDNAYHAALRGINTFEVSTDKFVVMEGGTERLWSLQTAYESLFVDPDVPELNGNIKQADGSLIDCTVAEWDSLMKLMREAGKNLFIKNETLIYKISILTDSSTMSEVWNTTWDNEA
jgi:hypothetical protein